MARHIQKKTNGRKIAYEEEEGYGPTLTDSSSTDTESSDEEQLNTSGEIDIILTKIGLKSKKEKVFKRKTQTVKKQTDPITFQVLAGTELNGKTPLDKANQLIASGKLIGASEELMNQLLQHKIGVDWTCDLVDYKNKLIVGNPRKK